MLNIELHKRWFARFFVLIILLFSTSVGNAFWCTGQKGNSHLELNSIGECQSACHSETENHQRNRGTTDNDLTLSDLEDDCFDSPAYSSFLTSSTQPDLQSNIAVIDLDQTHRPIIPVKSLSLAGRGNLTFASKLPPPQALTALRTVVLLH